MQSTSHAFPVHVRTGWIDFSPAVQWYAPHKLKTALEPVAEYVRSVTLRIADREPGDLATRVCTVDVSLKPTGALTASVTGTDVRELVDRTVDAIVKKVHAQLAEQAEGESLPRIA